MTSLLLRAAIRQDSALLGSLEETDPLNPDEPPANIRDEGLVIAAVDRRASTHDHRRTRTAVLGAFLWILMILLGSIVLDTFMVYPNIFHDPPKSFETALAFMSVRAPNDFYPPLGFLTWVAGLVSLALAWPERSARY